MKNRLKKIIENDYTYSVLTKIIGVVTGLVYTVIYSRYLGTELRGEASVINNYVELLEVILCVGAYEAYPFFKKKTGKDLYQDFIDNMTGVTIIYALIAAAVIIFIRPPMMVRIVCVLTPMAVGVRYYRYVVLIENPRIRNTSLIILDFFDIFLLLGLFIFTKSNYFYCILFLIVREAVKFIISFVILKVPIIKIRPTLKGTLKYLKYGVVPMLAGVLMDVNYKIDIIMLERLDIQKGQIGIYSLGVMFGEKLWMIPDALKDILTSKLAGGKKEEEVSKITRISVAVTLIFILGIAAVGKPMIKIIYGAEYSGAYEIFLCISLGILGMVFYKMVYAYNVVNGHKNVNFALLAMAAAINVGLNFFLIQKINITGAALASMVSYTICGMGFLTYFVKKTGTPLKDVLILKKSDLPPLLKIFKK